MTRLHIVGGSLDAPGGVADYTTVLAGALSSRGITTHIWDATADGVRTQIRDALVREPGPLLVQYVPATFGWKGANVVWCVWLLALRRQGHEVRVLFHEPYFYFSAHPLRNGLALVQRLMAAFVLRAATVCYVSTATWVRYLAPYAPRDTAFVPLPMPATVPRSSCAAREREWRGKLRVDGTSFVVGHFGTFGDHVGSVLRPIVGELLQQRTDVTVVCIGRGGEVFADTVRGANVQASSRVVATGSLADGDVAAVLRACDLLIQPYPDGVTTRRTSIMAGLANGVATVTSQGPLTEPLWTRSEAAAVAPVSDAGAHVREITRLLNDEGGRRDLAERGREFYDTHCSIDASVHIILGGRLAATA